MKVGILATPNEKGQIVIPQEYRKALGINSAVSLNIVLRGGGIYIYPIEGVITKTGQEDSYSKILERTRGAWRDDNTWDDTEKRRKKIEIAAAKKNKKAW